MFLIFLSIGHTKENIVLVPQDLTETFLDGDYINVGTPDELHAAVLDPKNTDILMKEGNYCISLCY